jgi:hypothetical protein
MHAISLPHNLNLQMHVFAILKSAIRDKLSVNFLAKFEINYLVTKFRQYTRNRSQSNENTTTTTTTTTTTEEAGATAATTTTTIIIIIIMTMATCVISSKN